MNHHARGMALSVAVVLLAYSVSLFTPEVIAKNVSRYLANAAIGVSTGVAPNPYNTLAEDLARMSDDLDARERRIIALEDELRRANTMESLLAYGSLALSTCLFMLVGVNFYMDSRRANARASTTQNGYAVNLRR